MGQLNRSSKLPVCEALFVFFFLLLFFIWLCKVAMPLMFEEASVGAAELRVSIIDLNASSQAPLLFSHSVTIKPFAWGLHQAKLLVDHKFCVFLFCFFQCFKVLCSGHIRYLCNRF
jgi:hypothetical protein